MKFGPAEMAQMMEGAKAFITVIMVSSVSIGIVLGAIVALYRMCVVASPTRADDHVELLVRTEVESAGFIGGAAHRAPGRAQQARMVRARPHVSVALLVITILIAIAGGGFFWYYTPKGSDFEATDNQRGIQPLPPTIEPQQQVRSDFEATYNQLGIQPLPLTVERQHQIQSRLAQLSREACYIDAIVGLGKALLDAGYPREAATSLRNFAMRCGSALEVLPLAYTALERISDFSGALEVANQLVEANPASGSFRYWRALAYDQTGNFSIAMLDYMNTIQLIGNPKTIFGGVFYKWSRTYAALGRYCDAISPIEMYISLDPANRRTPQTTKIISDYAEKGDCDKRYATGTARVPFAVGLGVRTLSVVVNNVAGTMILDTGATFVSMTSRFAVKARVTTESGNQVIMKTVGGKASADIGYANSIRVGKAAAFGVTAAVMRDDGDPFGKGVDGLLGMSFLSRFNVRLSPTEVEMTATPLR